MKAIPLFAHVLFDHYLLPLYFLHDRFENTNYQLIIPQYQDHYHRRLLIHLLLSLDYLQFLFSLFLI